MFKVTKFPAGTFSWADCATTDESTDKAFYQAVMKWDKNEMPMGGGQVYTMFMRNGETVAALSPMQPEMQSSGVPSHWNCYVTVDDVDAVTAKVAGLGGTVIAEPFDVFDNGRMSVIQDPTGATLSLWQPKTHIGASLVNAPGAMLWNELATRDPKKAQDFYGKLLGWTFTKMDDQDYWYVNNNGRMNGGMMLMTEEWGDMPANWMNYFNIENIDEAVERVKANGGSIMGQINEAPGVGRFAITTSPSGAVISIMQANEPQPWDA